MITFIKKSPMILNQIINKNVYFNNSTTRRFISHITVKKLFLQTTAIGGANGIDNEQNLLLQSCHRKNALNLGPQHIHTTNSMKIFWEPDRKGGYNKNYKRVSRKQLLLEGLQHLKQEILIWKDEVKEKLECDPIVAYRKGEIDVVWDFNEPETMNKWLTSSDSDHNQGQSYCTLEQSSTGCAMFSGRLDSKPPIDGKLKRAGYCNLKSLRARKSFKRETYLDWAQYNTLVIRLRGDGRSYLLNINTEGYFDIWWFDIYHYVLYTRGGPHWQTAKIPFSKFFLASKGRVQDRQCRIPLNKVTSFGISASGRSGLDGPFSLEIDYIGLEYDPLNNEEFAYEMYKMPKYVVAT